MVINELSSDSIYMNYYDDTNPLILEHGTSLDPYILGFTLGALFILLIHKYIYNNQ